LISPLQTYIIPQLRHNTSSFHGGRSAHPERFSVGSSCAGPYGNRWRTIAYQGTELCWFTCQRPASETRGRRRSTSVASCTTS